MDPCPCLGSEVDHPASPPWRHARDVGVVGREPLGPLGERSALHGLCGGGDGHGGLGAGLVLHAASQGVRGVQRGQISLFFRKTKSDQLAFGDTKTLQATGKRHLCRVEAVDRMRPVWTMRFQAGHAESMKPLAR